jgi:hypothetical protein
MLNTFACGEFAGFVLLVDARLATAQLHFITTALEVGNAFIDRVRHLLNYRGHKRSPLLRRNGYVV